MAYILACGHHIAHQDQPHDCGYLRLNKLLHLFELPRCVDALDADNVGLAIWIVRRINRIAALPPMLRLPDTTAPSGFCTLRPYLSPASGAESRQLRELELVVGARDTTYRDRREAASGTGAAAGLWAKRLNSLWNNRSPGAALHDLFERRDLTPDRIYIVALRANPNAESLLLVEALAGSAAHRFFPELWQLRTRLWERQGDCAHLPPDEPRHACPASAAMPLAGHQS